MNKPVYPQQLAPTPIPWDTPTPYPTVGATPPIDFGFESIQAPEMAETIVSGWQMINVDGYMDMVFWAVIVALLVTGAFSIKKHLKDA